MPRGPMSTVIWSVANSSGQAAAARPAKFPLFDPILPVFEPDRPGHGFMARTADRAVLIELRRFLAVIRVPLLIDYQACALTT